MTVSSVNSWSATWNVFSSATGVVLTPVNASLNIPVTGITGGNWLVATVGWSAVPAIPSTISVGDDACNWWVPIASSPANPLTDSFALNGNWNFATGATAPWTLTAGSTLAISSSTFHVPYAYSGAVTPNGSSASAAIASNKVDIHLRAGSTVLASAWALFTRAVTSAFSVAISFYDFGGSLISTSTGASLSAAANTWTQASNTTTAPSGAVTAAVTVQLTGTPPAANIFYVSEAKLYAPVALNYNPFLTNVPTSDGWTASNATLTSSTTVPFSSMPSLQITPTGAGNVTFTATSGHYAPVVAQQFYNATAWFNSPTGYNPVAAQISWYTAGLTLISTSVGTPSPVTPGSWSRVLTNQQAPSNAAFAAVGAVVQGSPQTWDQLYVSNVTLTQGLGLSSEAGCAIWVAPNIAAATTTVSIQPLGQFQGLSATVEEFSGMPAWLTVDVARGSYSNGISSTQLSLTPTQNDLVISTAASNLSRSWTLDRVSLSGWAPRVSKASYSFLTSSSASFEVASWQTASSASTAQFYNVNPLNNNPVFAASVSGWSSTNATLTSSSAFVWPSNSLDARLTSTRSALLTPNGSSASNNAYNSTATAPAVTPGLQYQAELYVYSPNGWSSYVAQIQWLNSGRTLLSTTTGQTFAAPAATWTNNYVVGVAPSGAAFACVTLGQNGTPPTSAVTYIGRGTLSHANDVIGMGVAQAMAAIQLNPTAPTVVNSSWPYVKLEVGFGQAASTPPSQVQWTDISNRLLSMSTQRGRQYELNSLQAGTINFVLRNDDGYLTPNNAASPYNCQVFNPLRVTAILNNKIYGIFNGYMERWPTVWTDPHWGEVNAIGIDSAALLSKTLQTMLQEEILLDEPLGYWPCNDGASSTIAANLGTQSTRTPLAISLSTGTSTAFNGILNDSSLGHGGTNYAVLPTSTPVNVNLGQSLVYGGLSVPIQDNLPMAPPLPSLDSGVTVLMFTGLGPFPSGVSSQVSSNIALFTAVGPTAPIIQVWLDTSYNVHVTTWNANTGATTDHGSITGPFDSFRVQSGDLTLANDLNFALEFNSTSFTLYVNGVFNASSQLSGTNTMSPVWNSFEVIGRVDPFVPGSPEQFGYIAVNNIALYDRYLPQARISTIFNATGGAGGDFGDVRVNRFLSYQQPVSARIYPDVRSNQTELIGSTAQSGQNIGSSINDVVTSEAALNYVDRNGYYVYRARQNATDRGIQAVFGENTAAGELPYLVSIELDYDPTYVYNDVQVTYVGQAGSANTPVDTLVSFSDRQSINQYGDRSLSVNQLVSNFDQVANLGNYLLNQYRQPSLRVAQVMMTPMARPSMFSTLLALDIGDRVTLNRRPVGSSPISINVMIIGIQHEISWSTGVWTVHFDIMPASIAALQTVTFTLDTAQLDLLDDGNVIGW